MAQDAITVGLGFSDTERPDVARVFWDGLGDKMGLILGPKERGIAAMAEMMDPAFVFTARMGGRVVGMAGLKRPDGAFGQPRSDILRRHFGAFGAAWRGALGRFDKAQSDPGILVLDALCVASDIRSKGTGAALMAACRTHGREQGLGKMTIQVIEENHAARRFYAREGCVEVGTQSMGFLGYLFGIKTMMNLELELSESTGD